MSDIDRKVGTYLVYIYLFAYYVRPQEYVPGLSTIRVSGIIFLATTVWGFIHFRPYLLRTPLLFVVFIGISLFLSGIGEANVLSYKLSLKYITEYFPQCIAVYLIFDSKERILNLINLWCVIYFFMAIITIKNGGLGPGDFTWDPNDAALALSMGIPWCVYSIRFLDLSRKQLAFYWLTFSLLVIAVITTQSRGGFLGLAAVFLMLWWFSEKRFKVAVVSTLVVVLLSGLLLSILPEGYINEVESINDPEDETRVERFRTWEIAWIMYKDNPILGVGGGDFPNNAGKYQKMTSWWTGAQKSLHGRVTHSVYFQVLSELGTVGAILYLYILFILPLKLYRLTNCLRSNSKDDRLIRQISLTLIVSMGAFAVSGAFISVAYYPHIPIWLAMCSILIRYWQRGMAKKPNFK